ncbi:endonuclease/exonuclease/phosphatase [Poronia punctata]|nr:endonuclease/exonuclease/phosphatase [Poronia punctata]
MHLSQALVTAIMATTTTTTTALDLRLATFNIRQAAPPSTYEKSWSERCPYVISTVKSIDPLIIGMQEVLHEQLVDIEEGLGGNWSYIGTGRDDGKQEGEYNPLWYRSDKFKLVKHVQKWLSDDTPDEPSKYPGAGSERVVVAGVFEEKEGGRRFLSANTHLDNESEEARVHGVATVLGVLRDLQKEGGGDLPVTLTGDFNSEPGDGDAYGRMVDDGYLKDLYALADEETRVGPFYETYTGFVPDEIPDVSQRIDFIWLGPGDKDNEKGWEVKRYEVVDNVVDGVFMSDHRPVVGDVSV